MADDELVSCEACGARFDVDQVLFEEPDPGSEDNSTQYGFLAGNCPECNAPLQLTLQQVQGLLARPEGIQQLPGAN